ncbi:hypothetical protein L873DRAFT_825972 [Choiromyces venosus 120613-1]|uniref:Uncharacterized protein n=1 Tax=Choiromyces venosus 120613-1 TaxID=1336337 RepID=A0A3N4JPV0_9PEZI|nr:hypothetical protein L873DRAFT_825622 [Choiromyces venosus 120613-1]RPB00340.1 hypothetical protein L873DRAFT_825972 [Choiromyces venosus 120613-1]
MDFRFGRVGTRGAFQTGTMRLLLGEEAGWGWLWMGPWCLRLWVVLGGGGYSWQFILFHVINRPPVSCPAVFCPTISCPTVFCPTVSRPPVSCQAILSSGVQSVTELAELTANLAGERREREYYDTERWAAGERAPTPVVAGPSTAPVWVECEGEEGPVS